MDEIQNPHDKLFKFFMSKKELAGDLIKNTGCKVLIDNIDLSYFEIADTNYIDPELKELYSDILIKTKLKGKSTYIALLFEHKSFKDDFSFVQILKYMLSIWEHEIMEKKNEPKKGKRSKLDPSLTPIIPILFYHADKKWSHGNEFNFHFDTIDNDIKSLLPNFYTVVFDLNIISNGDIHGSVWYQSYVRMMKHKKELEKGVLEELLDLLARLNVDLEADIEFFRAFLIYAFTVLSSGYHNYVKNLLSKKLGGTTYMTILDEIKKEGREEGREEGEKIGIEKGERKKAIETAKNLKKLGIDLDKIILATGLSENEIENL